MCWLPIELAKPYWSRRWSPNDLIQGKVERNWNSKVIHLPILSYSYFDKLTIYRTLPFVNNLSKKVQPNPKCLSLLVTRRSNIIYGVPRSCWDSQIILILNRKQMRAYFRNVVNIDDSLRNTLWHILDSIVLQVQPSRIINGRWGNIVITVR